MENIKLRKNNISFSQSHILYSIYDKKMDSYTPPFIQPNDGTAIRFIIDIITNDPNSTYARHSHDYELKKVARWDTRTGLLQPDHPITVQQISTIKQSMEK